MNSGYWKDKRVAVTGGAGFVGAQLVGELLRVGADVTVLDNFSRGKNDFHPCEYINGDATNINTCEYVFRGRATRGEPVDVVFNLAATVAGVLHNMSHHHEMFRDNVNLQVVPVMAAEKVGVETFVQVSSVCVYDPQHNHPAVEDVLGPNPHPANEGYAWAKRMGERAVMWSDLERGVIVRPSNIFGPYDYYDNRAHVIPALIKKICTDPVVHIYGKKDTVREFVYSRDVALGMMQAARYGENKQAYNLGCDGDEENVWTIEDLVTAIESVFGIVKTHEWHEDVGGGDWKRFTNCAKAFYGLAWDHMTGLHDGLRAIKQHFDEHGVPW